MKQLLSKLNLSKSPNYNSGDFAIYVPPKPLTNHTSSSIVFDGVYLLEISRKEHHSVAKGLIVKTTYLGTSYYIDPSKSLDENMFDLEVHSPYVFSENSSLFPVSDYFDSDE
jgi:hypothetical protein